MATEMQGGHGSATVPTTEILDGLNDLLQLDHDAIGAYEIAIARLDDRDHAHQISGFRLDHERHIRELNEMILRLGGTPVNEPHATGPFKQAMQSLGAMAGDRGTLLAWRANELQVRTKYDRYASRAMHWPAEVKQLIDRNALDEERHYRWVADALQAMGVGSGEGIEVDLIDGARERMNVAERQVGQLTREARERVSGAVESVRERAAEGMERVRERAVEGMDDVRTRTAGGIDTLRHRAADGLESAAGRLDGMIDRRQGADGAGGRAANVAHRVAGGMESTAGFLREAGVDQMRDDLVAQVRSSPIRTLAATFAVGILVGRILR